VASAADACATLGYRRVADSPNRDVLAFFSLDRLEVIGQEIDARQTANHRGIGTDSGSSGCSALIGDGGRCTARIVSEETKKLLQQLLQGRPVKLVGTDFVLAVAREAHCQFG